MKPGCSFAVVIGFVLAAFAGRAGAGVPAASSPGARQLLAEHAQLAPQLAHNAFGRPLVLQSQEGARQVGGDVYAEVDFPFAVVKQSLDSADDWCEVLILHLNTKSCRAVGDRLDVRVGRKRADVDDAFALAFAWRLQAATPDFLAAQVSAPAGPLGSRDYLIELQAVPIGPRRTFLRLHYSYAFGAAARLATKGYLATSGAGKIGFTREGSGYVGGLRGAVERNTMRYFLAIDCYLGSLAQPPGRRFATRIARWFDATEQYRAQLHEVERADYLRMKQHQYAAQQALAAN